MGYLHTQVRHFLSKLGCKYPNISSRAKHLCSIDAEKQHKYRINVLYCNSLMRQCFSHLLILTFILTETSK